jgi:hypothetical protein
VQIESFYVDILFIYSEGSTTNGLTLNLILSAKYCIYDPSPPPISIITLSVVNPSYLIISSELDIKYGDSGWFGH